MADPRRDETRSISRAIHLLGTRRFGTFWAGSLLSNIGTWMQGVAEPWLVLSLSGSSFLLGLDAFAADGPAWILTLFGGFLADHRDRRRVILSCQSIQMLCPILVVLGILTGTIRVWMIIALSVVVGVTDALSMPAFQAIVPSIVSAGDIGTAIALNSTQFNLSRIIGPAIAGIVMAKYGALTGFGANALSYVPFLLVTMWVLPRRVARVVIPAGERISRVWLREIREVSREPMLRGALLTVLGTSLLCGPLIAFSPVLIREVFHADVSHFAGALAAFGVGGLIGAVVLLVIEGHVDRVRLCSGAAMLTAVVVGVVAMNRAFAGLVALLGLAGIALTMSNTTANAILQSTAQDRLRGQTASLYMLAMRGGLSIGSLVAGVSVSCLGVRRALLINGVLALIVQSVIGRYWIHRIRRSIR